ncbi:c-type cytochrome [Methylobacter marinus]|uniref:c-type cytochrome n=1 Tax=Methylobacter marinus TaxID=34058 RepID=UPI000376839F|nr:cytochrome c [Methylobacter marinus]
MSLSMTCRCGKWIFAACAAVFLALLSVSAFAKEDDKWRNEEQVYAKICAYCHDVGVGPVIKGRQLTPTYIAAWVRHGWKAMPAFSSAFIDDKTLQRLAEYVSQSAPPQQ